jgi:hypothetical protein
VFEPSRVGMIAWVILGLLWYLGQRRSLRYLDYTGFFTMAHPPGWMKHLFGHVDGKIRCEAVLIEGCGLIWVAVASLCLLTGQADGSCVYDAGNVACVAVLVVVMLIGFVAWAGHWLLTHTRGWWG